MVRAGASYEAVYATEEWINRNNNISIRMGNRLTCCSPKELERMSALKSPQGVIALLHTAEEIPPIASAPVSLFCDRISDPGNLGTLLRIADWFGIDQVVMSPGTVSINNPKVIQASMGSWFRVPYSTYTLEELIGHMTEKPAVYGAVMEGAPLQRTMVNHPAIIALGNESEGLSDEVLSRCDYKVTIPRGAGVQENKTAESLNVAMAAALFSYHFTVVSVAT